MTTETSAAGPVVAETNAPPVASPDGQTTAEQGAESASAADAGDTSQPAKKVAWWDKRISELTKDKHSERISREQAEANAEYWRRYAMENIAKAQEQPKPQPSDKAKTLADFDYDEPRYQSYLFEQSEKRAVAAAEKRLKEQSEQDAAQRRSASFQTRETEFAKTVEDYHEVTRNPRVPISEAMAEAIADSDDGPALAYHLGKNLEVAARIAQLPPLAAARELGRIEARLASEREKAKDKPLVSKAPPPPPKIEGADNPVSVALNDPASDTAYSTEEWVKRREKQLRKKAK